MPTEVTMPKMGYDMEEGTLLSWRVSEGDTVAKGDILGEIETGKVTIEIEAFDAGVLLKILVPEGQTVPVGAPIAVIGAEGEAYTPAAGPESKAASGPSSAAANGAAERDGRASADRPPASGPEGAGAADGADRSRSSTPSTSSTSSTLSTPSADGGRLRISPLARRIAAEHGLDPEDLAGVGSGPSGRIVRDDVRAAIETRPAAAPSAPALAPAPAAAPYVGPAPSGPESTREELSRIRRTIAARLGQSWQAAPHIFLTTAVELDAALALRQEINAGLAAAGGGKVSVNDLVVKASAYALRRHPLMNVSWDEGGRIRHGRVNVGVAVALEDGLMTVTVPDADVKSLSAVSAEVAGKAGRARDGSLTPDDLAVPSTFTVSNLGMYGIDHFTAILNPPEAGILAVGAGTPTAVVRDGEIVVRTMMNLTLSADHRVVDGATAAEFLVTLRDALEHPLIMLV